MNIGWEVNCFINMCIPQYWRKEHRGWVLKAGSIAYPIHSYKPTLAKRLDITSGYIEPVVEIEWDTTIIYTNQLYIYTHK